MCLLVLWFFFYRNLLYKYIICTCYGLFEILKNYICLLFDETEFDFVTYVFYNEINNELFNEYVPYFIDFIVKLKI